MSIPTSRLILRQWRDSDLAPFRLLNADPEVMRYFPAPLSETESDDLASRARSHIDDHGWGLWAVEVVDGPSFIGFVGLWPAGIGSDLEPMTEVGWRLAATAWGHGYAIEAARQSVRHGFEELDLTEIVSFTSVVNRRSRAVMERLGMTRDPGDDFDHPRIRSDHVLAPHVLYRLRADQWDPSRA